MAHRNLKKVVAHIERSRNRIVMVDSRSRGARCSGKGTC